MLYILKTYLLIKHTYKVNLFKLRQVFRYHCQSYYNIIQTYKTGDEENIFILKTVALT